MKYIVLICLFVLFGFNLFGQSKVNFDEGIVSYITSQSVYVKFKSTKNISVGDTLFVHQNGKTVPALLVGSLSSISCVCKPISLMEFKVNDKMVIFQKQQSVIDTSAVEKTTIQEPIKKPDAADSNSSSPIINAKKQKVAGRLSIASYSNFSNTDGGNSQRMRYTFSMNVKNIVDSKFSVETYLSFVHRDDNWDEIKENVFNGLKVYNFAVAYEPSEKLKIWLGRRINSIISNIGAIDGIQSEYRFSQFTVGAFVGSRPDYINYSYNFELFQFGSYLGHNYSGKNGNMQSTIAFVEQKNNWNTDRRFAYFQHYNSLVKNLSFFATAELELYQNINGVESSNLNFTNLYLMLRYKVTRQLSLSLSYRSQVNMIYYETYKSFVDQLIDDENVIGYRLQVNYRPIKYLSVGARVGYRNSKNDPRPSKNAYGYLSYSRIPFINASATLSVTLMETSYLSGKLYGISISRDIVPGKLFGGINYHYVDYTFINYESSLVQNVGNVNLTWRMMKKLSLTMTYEGIFEVENTYNRVYINLIKRL